MDLSHEQGGRSFVLFRLGAEEYGLPIERVQSIIRYEEATPVPHTPEYVEGVLNLRGMVIPVVDLTRRLSGVTFEPGPQARIVVAEGESGPVGLAVNSASEVVVIDAEAVKPAPESALSPQAARALEGVAEHEGRLVILLDLDQAVPKAEYGPAHETEHAAQEDETDA